MATATMTKYDLAATLTLADLDGYHGKLTAKQQRDLFGQVLFGKKTVEISCEGQGSIAVLHPCWEGTHTSYTRETRSFEAICASLN